MKTPKKTGNKPDTRKSSDNEPLDPADSENVKPVSKFDDDDDDFELPLEEIEGFDEYNEDDEDDF